MKYKVSGEVRGHLYKIVEAKDKEEALLMAGDTFGGNDVDWEPFDDTGVEAEEYKGEPPPH